ncbi:hypothetical protein M8J77_010838 [Diaphorina citri]|nr:hypothetical protein M8J77_010838 [Diaphorina citri]
MGVGPETVVVSNLYNATTTPDPVESTITELTTTAEPETVVFSHEGNKITIFKEVMDDASAVLDLRINNAQLSCPREFAISQSGIPDLKLGVWTKVDLPAGVVFGPFRGRVDLTNSHEDSEDRAKPADHVLHIYHPKTRVLLFQIDARSNTLGNWCRYINAARHISEQNVELFFEEGQPFPYFRTIRNISRHTEVLANFGNEFRKGKYVNLVNVQFNLPLPQPLPHRKFPCSRCGLDQGSPVAIQRHRKTCNSTAAKGKKDRAKRRRHNLDESSEEITTIIYSTMDKEALERLKSRFHTPPRKRHK